MAVPLKAVVQIRETDRGYADLKRAMVALRSGGAYAKAGIMGDGPLATIAMVHEFGSEDRGIPERSFLRAAFDAHRDEYIGALAKLCRGVYEGKGTVRQALTIVAMQMSRDQKALIRAGEGIPPPNAPETIRRKGSSHTLIDAGEMVRALTHAVVLPSGS